MYLELFNVFTQLPNLNSITLNIYDHDLIFENIFESFPIHYKNMKSLKKITLLIGRYLYFSRK